RHLGHRRHHRLVRAVEPPGPPERDAPQRRVLPDGPGAEGGVFATHAHIAQIGTAIMRSPIVKIRGPVWKTIPARKRSPSWSRSQVRCRAPSLPGAPVALISNATIS